MKNRKIKIIGLLVLCLTTLCFILTSCHYQHVNPGKLEDLVGTYKLVEHTYTPDDVSGQAGEQKNLLQENNEEAYLVINSNGYGYYAFKDNLGSWIDTVKFTFTYDTDDSSLISSVEYTRGINIKEGADQPGCGSENLGFDAKNNLLTYNISNTKVKIGKIETGYDFSSFVKYEKVDNDTTGSYLASKMNVNISNLVEYNFKCIDGKILKYSTSPQEDNNYIYRYLIIDSKNHKYSTYYASIPSQPGDNYQQLSILNGTYTTQEQDQKLFITFNNMGSSDSNYYYLNLSGLTPSYNLLYSTIDQSNEFYHSFEFNIVYDEKTIDELIDQDIQAYNLAQSNPQ